MIRIARSSVAKLAWSDDTFWSNFNRVQHSRDEETMRSGDESGFVPDEPEDNTQPDASVFVTADEANMLFPEYRDMEISLDVWYTGSTDAPENIRILAVMGPEPGSQDSFPENNADVQVSPDAAMFLQKEIWKEKNKRLSDEPLV
jgi:hypothetical protein